MTGKNFQLAFEVGGKVAASLPKSFSVASQAVARLNQELSEIRQQQRSVKKLQDMKLKVGQTAKAYHKAAARVEQLHQQLSQTESPTRAMTREFERAKTQSSYLRDALRKQRQELVTLKRGFDDADTSARHLALRNKELAASADRNRLAQSRSVEQVHRYKVALGEARRNIQQTRRAQETLNRTLEQQRALKVAALGEAKGKLFSSAAQTAAVTGGAMLAAAKAANFNRENQLIGNTADMSANEVKAMGDAMLITARQTGQFTDDIQAAQGYLVAAGQGYREAQANLKTIGQTATATGADILDVSKATFILGDALKINPKEMQAALDILVQSGKEGNFEFNDMAKTLPVLGAQFQSLKMGGTEAAATMGAALQIARKGASTSDEAANNMKNFMAKILAPATLKRAKKEFDVDLYAIITKAQKSGKNPFEAAIHAVTKMTQGGDQKLLGQLFADMQVQNFVRPMLQNFKEYEAIKEKALSSKGVIDRDFVTMTKENAQRLKDLRIAADTASLSFGQALQPAMAQVLTVVVPLVTAIAEFIANNPNFVAQITLITGAMLTFRTATLACRVAMLALSVATKVTPLGWIQIAIMAAVAAGIALYENWAAIKAYAMELWPKIKTLGVEALDALKFVFMNFTPVGWLIQAFQAGKELLSAIDWSASGQQIIQTLIEGIKAKATALVDEVKEIFAEIRDYLPFSDARIGPFSELTRSGAAIMGTLAQGVNRSSTLQTAIAEKFNDASVVGGGISGANNRVSAGAGSAGMVDYGTSITFAPVIHLPPGSPADNRAAVERGLKTASDEFEKKMKEIANQNRRLSYG
ncbi:phage tail tape measure protein [Yersinia mollaretii]|uniref:phage tail tape measure protein n=1 Tax=Yersinia mollaretii TaxID=33060 RepID=UPI0021BDB4B7|nr:phage tail tape measure protein [Yersinia mollaretii]